MSRRLKLLFLLFFITGSLFAANPVLFNGTFAYTPEQRLLVMTLAGIVNRDSARLYMLNVYEPWSYSKNDEQWRDIYRTRGGVQFDSLSSVTALVERFRPFLHGAVTYDPGRFWGNFSGQYFAWQGEYAALIGGLTDRLPASPSLAATLSLAISDSVLVTDSFDGDSSVTVPARMENTLLPWNDSTLSEENKYLLLVRWGIHSLLPRCNPHKFYLREITDFAVQKKMFQANLAGTDDLDLNLMPTARADLLETILTYFHSKNPGSIFHIYGWIRPEPMTQWFACFGASFHETLMGNLSWHSSFPAPQRTFIPPGATSPGSVTVENKVYVAFIGSEGDASNWCIGLQSGAWLSSARGTVPVTWGWNLHLLNECPFIAGYYFDTATPHDGFASVISPLGYAYPDLWQSDVWDDAIVQTEALMNKFHVYDIYAYKHYAGSGVMVYRGKTISNSFNFARLGQFQASAGVYSTLLYDPQLAAQSPLIVNGALVFNHCDVSGRFSNTFYTDVSNLDTYAGAILANIRKLTKPGFLLAGYQRLRQDDFTSRSDPASSDISLPRLAQTIQKVQADTTVGKDVEFVTVEKFSALMRKKLGLVGLRNPVALPSEFSLKQNYPNPFNGTTTFRLSVPVGPARGIPLELSVFDVLGRKVDIIIKGNLEPGTYTFQWDASDRASGIYYCLLRAAGVAQTVKAILMK